MPEQPRKAAPKVLPPTEASVRLAAAIQAERCVDLHFTDPAGRKITVVVETPEQAWWEGVSEGDTMMLPVLAVAEQGPPVRRPPRDA